MIHIAFMKKGWNFTHKIELKIKTIESRWYKNKYSPIGKIFKGDIVYFKDSNEAIKLSARVSKIICYENLNQNKVSEILNNYYSSIGIEPKDLGYFYEVFKGKKYCLLIFLEDVKKIKPFSISKKGFGAMASWICVEDLKKIKI